MNLISSCGHSNVNLWLSSIFFDLISFATPSTWPVTMCPPNSSPILRDFSKLTFLPIFQGLFDSMIFDFDIVSLETSTS